MDFNTRLPDQNERVETDQTKVEGQDKADKSEKPSSATVLPSEPRVQEIVSETLTAQAGQASGVAASGSSTMNKIHEADQLFRGLSDVQKCETMEEAYQKFIFDEANAFIWQDQQRPGHYNIRATGMGKVGGHRSYGPEEFIDFMRRQKKENIQSAQTLLGIKNLTTQDFAQGLFNMTSKLRKCGNINKAVEQLNRFPSLKYVVWESSQKGSFSVLERVKGYEAVRMNAKEFKEFMLRNNELTLE